MKPKGQGLLEYALIIVLLSVIVVAVLAFADNRNRELAEADAYATEVAQELANRHPTQDIAFHFACEESITSINCPKDFVYTFVRDDDGIGEWKGGPAIPVYQLWYAEPDTARISVSYAGTVYIEGTDNLTDVEQELFVNVVYKSELEEMNGLYLLRRNDYNLIIDPTAKIIRVTLENLDATTVSEVRTIIIELGYNPSNFDQQVLEVGKSIPISVE